MSKGRALTRPQPTKGPNSAIALTGAVRPAYCRSAAFLQARLWRPRDFAGSGPWARSREKLPSKMVFHFPAIVQRPIQRGSGPAGLTDEAGGRLGHVRLERSHGA